MIWSRPIPLGWYFNEQWRRFLGSNWVEQQCDNFIKEDRWLKNFAAELPVVRRHFQIFSCAIENIMTPHDLLIFYYRLLLIVLFKILCPLT